MSDIAINMVSTGDPEKDREQLELAALHQARIDADCCPNGCGQMFVASERLLECTECGFVLSKSVINY